MGKNSLWQWVCFITGISFFIAYFITKLTGFFLLTMSSISLLLVITQVTGGYFMTRQFQKIPKEKNLDMWETSNLIYSAVAFIFFLIAVATLITGSKG